MLADSVLANQVLSECCEMNPVLRGGMEWCWVAEYQPPSVKEELVLFKAPRWHFLSVLNALSLEMITLSLQFPN